MSLFSLLSFTLSSSSSSSHHEKSWWNEFIIEIKEDIKKCLKLPDYIYGFPIKSSFPARTLLQLTFYHGGNRRQETKKMKKRDKKMALRAEKKERREKKARSPTSGYIRINGNEINLIYLRISASWDRFVIWQIRIFNTKCVKFLLRRIFQRFTINAKMIHWIGLVGTLFSAKIGRHVSRERARALLLTSHVYGWHKT